jgi:hypothetical protein
VNSALDEARKKGKLTQKEAMELMIKMMAVCPTPETLTPETPTPYTLHPHSLHPTPYNPHLD